MFQSLNSRNLLQNCWLTNAAPRYFLPSLVMLEFVLSKRCFAVSKNPAFTTSHDLFVFGKYPNIEPKSVSFVPPLPQ